LFRAKRGISGFASALPRNRFTPRNDILLNAPVLIREVKTMFKGKKAIVIGERDGVPGPAIAKCLSAAGAEIVYTTTECFV